MNNDVTRKPWFLALMCWLFGFFGVHRFLVGKVGSGVAFILTLGGGFGIGVMIDFIVILCGKFKNKQGEVLGWK